MAGIINFGEMSISDRRQSLLFVRALGVGGSSLPSTTRTGLDAAKKLHGLGRVKGLRGDRAMQRIKFPNPLALSILLHP